jgi:hypothetical protein
MEIAVTYPGVQASDPRNTVTLRERATPWPIRFHFLRMQDTDTGEFDLVNVGFEVGDRFEVTPGAAVHQLGEPPRPLDMRALQRVTENYSTYLELARRALILDREGMAGAVELLRGPGKKPARLTDDFYRLIASDYEARRRSGEAHLVKALAEAHHVTASAASRWIKEARRRGYIEERKNDG